MTAAEPDHEWLERFGIVGFDGGPIRTDVARRLLQSLRLDQAGAADAPTRPSTLGFSGTQGCFVPEWLRYGKAWGITTQLYELRSRRSCGIGDFDDLRLLCTIAARAGADFVGVTPLHANFLAAPQRCSPFSPSNRRFLNPLYIALHRLRGYGQPTEIDPLTHQELATSPLVDYAKVAGAKLPVLRRLWRHWLNDPAAEQERAWFEIFRKKEGQPLHHHALFEVLSAEMAAAGHGAGWTGWPERYRDPGSFDVAAMEQEHRDDIDFHCWLQWVAVRQLESAATAARDAGMRIGLYLDLAVGEAPDGSAVWSERSSYVDGATIGAPPDYFSAEGQDWGLKVVTPQAIEAGDGAPFRQMIEHGARGGGALRLDHVMALWQVFVIPTGLSPRDGAYVRYPIDKLLQILASASRDARFVVIGEDLGHVPDGFREVMARAGVLSYRILYFEKAPEGGFLPAPGYPRLSIACVSTHDLPTLAGWWQGDDIRLRLNHNLITEEMAQAQTKERADERRNLLDALSGDAGETVRQRSPDDELPVELAAGVYRFLARSEAMLVGVRLADLVGETLPTNLPGTIDSHPNWRRRCRVLLERLEETPHFAAITRAVADARPR
ncbi:MAG: 4-alpha-glucanotransferase [Rhizobiaceae bacterium]|nr:4-alpha-glucanotransferase [Rhizobiaceae bacterium]MCV0407526.1 4-alpha-glucanotransferase [Rhizobiaceae bacterium]